MNEIKYTRQSKLPVKGEFSARVRKQTCRALARLAADRRRVSKEQTAFKSLVHCRSESKVRLLEPLSIQEARNQSVN